MAPRAVILILATALMAACTASQRAPTLSSPAESTGPPAPRRDLLQEVGDALTRVVTAPVRIVVPEKRPQSEPESYDPPVANFTQRTWDTP